MIQLQGVREDFMCVCVTRVSSESLRGCMDVIRARVGQRVVCLCIVQWYADPSCTSAKKAVTTALITRK